MQNAAIHQKFTAALDALIEQVKEDRSILAAILCGSLSHDAVWAKSDIDLVLVTIDDKKVECGGLSLYADGVNVHAFIFSRAQFRQTVEGALHNSFMHSLLAKGRLLYTHDRTIADLFDSFKASANATFRCNCCARDAAHCQPFTRPTNFSSRVATWITPHCGFCTPPLRSPRLKSSARTCWPTVK
jgi:hypothetical protein